MSESSWGPAGMLSKWLCADTKMSKMSMTILICAEETKTAGEIAYLLSPLLTASINLESLSSFSASSPKLMISTATLFFLSFFPSLTRSCSEEDTGEPTKRMTR